MKILKPLKMLGFLSILLLFFNSCNGKLPGGDARKFPADPEKRIQKNIADGKSLQMNEIFGQTQGGRVFDFASSNNLWRASLDVIDFMPLVSVNYSGGIIITDWYSENSNSNESFYEMIEKNETHFQNLLASANEKGARLKYVAQLENGKASVGLQEINPSHDFYNLEGSDNIILFYTNRYKDQPLIIKGAGAGAEVTAAGIFGDIIRIGKR